MIRAEAVGSFLLAEIVCQFCNGSGAVADVVLHLCAQFGKGLAGVFRAEDGIVTKALRASLLGSDGSFDDSFEEMLLPFFY